MIVKDVPVGNWFMFGTMVCERKTGETKIIEGKPCVPAQSVSHIGPPAYVPAEDEVTPYNLNFVRIVGVVTFEDSTTV